jgi:hypothetical protein
MHKTSRLASIALITLSLAVCASACKPTDSPSDSGLADAAPDGPTTPNDAGTAITGTKPLASGCSSDGECASGFCVDGVCCDSRCDQQCASCGLPGAPGYCVGQIVGDDLAATAPCTGAKTCSLDLTSPTLASCRLKSGQACTTNAECATANCATFFADADRDGYGGMRTLRLCESTADAAPAGYTSVGGDCCDTDGSAFPGQTAYFTVEDACGGWDYSCDGAIQGQNGYSSMYCGQTLGTGSLSGHVTVACH